VRITPLNQAPIASRGDHVVYWMIAARRTRWNPALDHAIARAKALDRPLIIVEPLRVAYPWASDRLHRFVIDGMAANAAACAAAKITYHPYVEPTPGAGKGMIAALAARAACVITDEWPGMFLPRMVAAAAAQAPVRFEQVDGNGLLPLRAHGRAFTTAASFRWHWQKVIGPHLGYQPAAEPLARLPAAMRDAPLPRGFASTWPAASAALLAGDRAALAALPIDHTVAVVDERGGAPAAGAALDRFIAHGLARYADERSAPESSAASGLSPWLHFGHIGAHEIFDRVWRDAGWDPGRVASASNGSRDGWWGLPAPHNAFVDELLTWRELGFGFAFHRPDHDQWASLPDWARATLDAHAADPRPHVYPLAQLAAAHTHDPLWNAAQTQLVRTGRMHNYLRMLWGKKILEWSASPRAALAALIELNNRYALDGRDPNSYSGICWTLGRFDRAWGPERKIFGTIRYMSSENTARKFKVKGYLAAYAPQARLL
jgi:deoxyribodipyrimidine photo-lyase